MPWVCERRSGEPVTGSDAEARAFAAAFRSFLEWVHSEWNGAADHNEVAVLIRDFLGSEGQAYSVVSRALPVFEHVNLQTALNAWSAQPRRSVEVRGITIPPHYGSVNLQQLLTVEDLPPLRLSAPPLVDLPNGPASTLACLVLAVLLIKDERGSYAMLVIGPSEHDPRLVVEIAGLPVDAAQAVHAELDMLRNRLNVYRGHVLDVGVDPMGGVILSFGDLPAPDREDVILPEAVLARVERHALASGFHVVGVDHGV